MRAKTDIAPNILLQDKALMGKICYDQLRMICNDNH